MISVPLPWPSRALHPNARAHWRAVAKAKQQARAWAAWAARSEGLGKIDAPAIRATFVFFPPDYRRRDLDGMLSSMKAAIDGLADVIKIDDSKWEMAIRRGDPVKGGLVKIELEVMA